MRRDGMQTNHRTKRDHEGSSILSPFDALDAGCCCCCLLLLLAWGEGYTQSSDHMRILCHSNGREKRLEPNINISETRTVPSAFE